MAVRDIIVIGTSAGGIEALQRVARELPADFPGSIFVTVHFPAGGTSVLPKILNRAGPLCAARAVHGESIEPGRIYVAPPDYHLLLTPDGVELVRGPSENGHRPAIDPMFRSAAVAFGARVIGVVLTGNLDDGTAGIAAIKRGGGLTIAQDPADALFPSMPESAITHVGVDRVAPLSELVGAITELMHQPIPAAVEAGRMCDDVNETEISAINLETIGNAEQRHGKVSGFGCPDCGGVLWQMEDGALTRFRCRVGHAWTGDALLAEQAIKFDDALWVALRNLEEAAALAHQLAAKQHRRGHAGVAQRFEGYVALLQDRAETIRSVLVQDRESQTQPVVDHSLVNPAGTA